MKNESVCECYSRTLLANNVHEECSYIKNRLKAKGPDPLPDSLGRLGLIRLVAMGATERLRATKAPRIHHRTPSYH